MWQSGHKVNNWVGQQRSAVSIRECVGPEYLPLIEEQLLLVEKKHEEEEKNAPRWFRNANGTKVWVRKGEETLDIEDVICTSLLVLTGSERRKVIPPLLAAMKNPLLHYRGTHFLQSNFRSDLLTKRNYLSVFLTLATTCVPCFSRC